MRCVSPFASRRSAPCETRDRQIGHAEKTVDAVDAAARHDRDRAVRETAQLGQQHDHARLHQHAVRRGREFDERAVEVEEKCRLTRRQNSRKCLHRLILPFSLLRPEKCAHLTAHPSIFRESKPGHKPGRAAQPTPLTIAFKKRTIGLQRAFSRLRQIASQTARPRALRDVIGILRYSRCHADHCSDDHICTL